MAEKIRVEDNGGWFLSALTLLFIAFKLLGKIDWSWWWVLSPITIPLGIILVIFVIAAVVYIFED